MDKISEKRIVGMNDAGTSLPVEGMCVVVQTIDTQTQSSWVTTLEKEDPPQIPSEGSAIYW